MSGRRLDVSADLGEVEDPDALGPDAAVLESVTTAHVACGFHAGSLEVMAAVVELAAARGVVVGAHPSYADRAGFGRRILEVAPDVVVGQVLDQVLVLEGVAAARGLPVRSVKPHGALYHRLASDPALAEAVAEALGALSPVPWLVLPAASRGLEVLARSGVAVAAEGFCDRGYEPDGSLVPRGSPGALVSDPAVAAARAAALAAGRPIEAVDGTLLELHVDTLCVHGDTPGAPEFAAAVRQRLEAEGVAVAPLDFPPR